MLRVLLDGIPGKTLWPLGSKCPGPSALILSNILAMIIHVLGAGSSLVPPHHVMSG